MRVFYQCQKNLFRNYVDKKNREFYENITGKVDKSGVVLFLTDIIDQKLFSYDMEKTLFYNMANENKEEVDEIIEVPVPALLNQNCLQWDTKLLGDKEVDSYTYHYQGRVIWGATARILNKFLDVFTRAMQDS